MSDAAEDSVPPPRYVYVWYPIAGLLTLGSIVCSMLYITDDRMVMPFSVAQICLAAVITATTFLCQRFDRRHQAGRRHFQQSFESLIERVELAAAYQVAVEVQRAVQHADDLYAKAMKEAKSAGVFEISERLDKFRAEVDERIAAALVAGLRSQESGNPESAVVPFTRRN